jgi:hypothetical protein
MLIRVEQGKGRKDRDAMLPRSCWNCCGSGGLRASGGASCCLRVGCSRAWLGLTPRRYQSGKIDYEGHISGRGGSRLRALLYEAAMRLLTRIVPTARVASIALKTRVSFKRASVALVRKMAVILHAMWRSGTKFNPTAAPA